MCLSYGKLYCSFHESGFGKLWVWHIDHCATPLPNDGVKNTVRLCQTICFHISCKHFICFYTMTDVRKSGDSLSPWVRPGDLNIIHPISTSSGGAALVSQRLGLWRQQITRPILRELLNLTSLCFHVILHLQVFQGMIINFILIGLSFQNERMSIA